MREIILQEVDHNLLGYCGEIYLEDDRLLVDIAVSQEYITERGDYFHPDTVSLKDPEVHINSVYFVADDGKEINVFSREMENFVKESIEIKY